MSIIKILSSRTNLVTLITFCLNYAQFLTPFIDPNLMILINGVLASMAVYYRINPKAEF